MPEPRITHAHRALLAGGACLIILAGMLGLHAWPLLTGESIYLKVVPVDPRDLFRGEYVVLGYDLSTLIVREDAGGEPQPGTSIVEPIGSWWDDLRMAVESEEESAIDLFAWRDAVLYVQLEETPLSIAGVPAVYRAVSVSDAPQPGMVNLRGRVRYLFPQDDDGHPGPSIQMNVHYGIDAFFVQEGRGKEIEEAIRDGEIHAIVAVTDSGRARVRDLVIDGRRWSDRIRDAGNALP